MRVSAARCWLTDPAALGAADWVTALAAGLFAGVAAEGGGAAAAGTWLDGEAAVITDGMIYLFRWW
jgi:hypothetical protein